mmetsp:Transcript_4846/g.7497  ORF Transcript_4846/g.7497 Transcript_4846/m.7497 type:complete len:89 (-) Transcript_4846:5-271(-)
MRNGELGLHKAMLLPSGNVHMPHACGADHGIQRGLFHKERHFPVLNEANVSSLKTGSGTLGDKDPDVFWIRNDEFPRNSRPHICWKSS